MSRKKDVHLVPPTAEMLAKVLAIASAAAAVLILSGCTGYSAAAMPPIPATEKSGCHLLINREGIEVMVDPFVEAERLEKWFGENLREHQILPVLVIVENHSGPGGFVLETSSAQVLLQDGRLTSEPHLRKSIYQEDAAGATMRLTSLAVSPLAGLAYMGIFNPERQQRKTLRLADRMADVEYTQRTLYPGELHHGMLYFRLQHPEDADRIVGFSVRGRSITLGQSIDFLILKE